MTIDFYSTKKKGEVSIPNKKVCAARYGNSMMTSGYSNAVRAGSDNGVVNQKLSRFATNDEVEEAGKVCSGNTNWLGYKGPSFGEGITRKQQFNMDRPSSLAGELLHHSRDGRELTDNQRVGIGNRTIVRDNFLAPELVPRQFGFDKIQPLNLSSTYTPSTLISSDAYDVRVPDDTDFEWLNERKRLYQIYLDRFKSSGFNDTESKALSEKELRTNLPLGREQRMVMMKKNNISNQDKLNFDAKLRTIIKTVREGKAEGRQSKVELLTQLTKILEDTTQFNNTNRVVLDDLGATLKTIGVPSKYQDLGLKSRIVDSAFYTKNVGVINLLIFNKVYNSFTRSGGKSDPEYNYDTPVKNFQSNARSATVTISTLANYLSQKIAWLDLERCGIIDLDQLKIMVANTAGGLDNSDMFSFTEIDGRLTSIPSTKAPVQPIGPNPQPTPQPTKTSSSSSSSSSSQSNKDLIDKMISGTNNISKMIKILKSKLNDKLPSDLKSDIKSRIKQLKAQKAVV